MAKEGKKKKSLSAFTILVIILAVLCLLSLALNGSEINDSIIKSLNPDDYQDLLDVVSEGKHVTVENATLGDFIMAIPNGFIDAADLLIFIFCLGGFIGVTMSTGALNAGVSSLVQKNRGNEEKLIVILMILFSIGGTTYGMAEETIGFYAFITSAMVMAGFDTMVALAVVLLGSASGVLGSTINPFATGVAMSSLSSVGIEADKGLVYLVGAILWISSTALAIWYTLRYAKKVKKDKGSTILTLQEQEDMKKTFGEADSSHQVEFTGKHKGVLIVFMICFIVMILSLISYKDINFGGDEEAYLAAFGWSDKLTGQPLGYWYFTELAAWFTLGSIVIALIAKQSEHQFIDEFIAGAQDLLSVAMVIAVSRGITVVMAKTHMDFWILDKCSSMLQGVPGFVFVPLSLIVYVLLSFLVPSTSGLAGLSMPVMGGLAAQLGFSPSIMINIFSAGSGVVNMFTPTSGIVMGGAEASHVEYSTYVKWVRKLLLIILIANAVVLTVAQAVVGAA